MAMNMNEISNDALKLWKIKRKFRKAKSGHGWTNIGEDITDCHLGNNHKKQKKTIARLFQVYLFFVESVGNYISPSRGCDFYS